MEFGVTDMGIILLSMYILRENQHGEGFTFLKGVTDIVQGC